MLSNFKDLLRLGKHSSKGTSSAAQLLNGPLHWFKRFSTEEETDSYAKPVTDLLQN